MSKRVESEKKAPPRRLGVVSQLIKENANALDKTDARLQKALNVAIENIHPNPNQPRKADSKEQDQELAENIREYGVLEPLLVREIGEGEYEIIAGERRYKAAQAAGLARVPVIVKDYNDQKAQFVAAIENLQRLDLDPLDEARYFRFLCDNYNYSYQQIADLVNRSKGYVADRMKRLEQEGMKSKQAADDSETNHNHSDSEQKLRNSQLKEGKEGRERYTIKPLVNFDKWIDRTAPQIEQMKPKELTNLREMLSGLKTKIAALEEMLPGDGESRKR